MDTIISSTEAVRHFGDVLARVKYAGETFLLTKSDKPLARLVGVAGPQATGRDILNALENLPADPAFADDLEKVGRLDKVPENPWD